MRALPLESEKNNRRKKMKKLFRKLEDIYAAAAFAEEGEFEAARQILNTYDRVADRKRKIAVDRKERRIKIKAS